MRGSFFDALVVTGLVAVVGCRSKAPTGDREVTPSAVASASAAPSTSRGAVAAVERQLQTTRLALPARRRHLPRLAFGSDGLGRLRDGDLQVLDARSLEEIATLPLARPRALLRMADGALVAIGDGGVVRWAPGRALAPTAGRVVLFPGAEVYPDARQADLLWVFEPDTAPPKLYGYRLGISSLAGVLTPEQAIELESPRGGTFGVTREGVWLYVTQGRVERLAPSGLELPGLSSGPTVPGWSLPARRLDQSLWIDESGVLTRALVSPVFKALSSARTSGSIYAASVGDEGRLLALISVTGAGPRFELALFDAELRERGRGALVAEGPTGELDWVRVVTRNQELAVAPREARVAVGGPDRLMIFDGAANPVLSIPIK